MYSRYRKPVYASLDQDPPVLGIWYPILDTTGDVRLLYIAVRRLDDDAVAKETRISVTIDGVVVTGAQDQNDNTWYYWYLTPDTDTLTASATIRNSSYYTEMRGHSVLVEVRQVTDAIGANAELDGRVQYEVMR